MATYTQPTGFLAATFPTTVASTTNITGGTITTVTNVTNDVGITQAGADKVWSTAARSLTVTTGFRLSSVGVDDIVRTGLTEGYAADGATFTLEQGMYMLWSALQEFSIAGTTITGKKLDGSTTSMTWTLDSSTAPTSRTRAT
jgi:hypothetical protein